MSALKCVVRCREFVCDVVDKGVWMAEEEEGAGNGGEEKTE